MKSKQSKRVRICVLDKTSNECFLFSACATETKEDLKKKIQNKVGNSNLDFGFFKDEDHPRALMLWFLARKIQLEKISSISGSSL